ncbi:MAG: DUF1648 domain-containing protein [Edaphobacter sp.]
MKAVREIVAALGVLCTIAVVADFYSRLPAKIATHFNAAGVAEGLGAKSTLWLLVGITVWTYAIMSSVNFLRPMVHSRRPLTAGQETAVWASVVPLVGWVKAEMAWVMAYLCLAVVRNGLGLQVGLGRWFGPVSLAVIGATCAFYFVRIMRLMRAD